MSLEITHGVVRRGRRAVLETGRIASDVRAIAVVGINGSGKSSLFMHITDTLRTSRGSASITFNGRPASLAYVPQEPMMPSWLRVKDVVRMHGLEMGELIDRMPGMHLDEIREAHARAMSVGQRQALAIAVAIGRNADVTLLDEPFSALDFRRRIGAIDLLREHCANGRAILLSSQSAADLVDLCGHFVVIRSGRYVFNGAQADLAGDETTVERRLLQLLT